MKLLIVLLLIAGIIFIAYGVISQNMTCPPPTTEIRYVPMTMIEEQDNQLPLSYTIGNMFEDASPWLKIQGSANSNDVKQ
jgi:hypothetical protein